MSVRISVVKGEDRCNCKSMFSRISDFWTKLSDYSDSFDSFVLPILGAIRDHAKLTSSEWGIAVIAY